MPWNPPSRPGNGQPRPRQGLEPFHARDRVQLQQRLPAHPAARAIPTTAFSRIAPSAVGISTFQPMFIS